MITHHHHHCRYHTHDHTPSSYVHHCRYPNPNPNVCSSWMITSGFLNSSSCSSVYLFCELIVFKLDLACRLISFSISKLIIHSMTLYSLERSNTTSMFKKMKFTSVISYLQLEERLCRWTRPSGRWHAHRVHWGAAVGSTLKIYKKCWHRFTITKLRSHL